MLNDKNSFAIALALILVLSLFMWTNALSNSGNATSFILSPAGGDPKGGGGGKTTTYCGNVNAEAQAAGKDGCADNAVCGEGSCCDYELAAGTNTPTGKCICEEIKNPCGTDNKKCMACMGYAEAGGSTINDDCMKYAMCAAKNRVGDKDFGSPKNECDAVAQGNGKQFNVYSCVCNNQSSNQKYCDCCAGKFKNDAEKAEADKAKKIAENLDCSGFPANSFRNAGMRAPINGQGKACTKVSTPACPTLDFYAC